MNGKIILDFLMWYKYNFIKIVNANMSQSLWRLLKNNSIKYIMVVWKTKWIELIIMFFKQKIYILYNLTNHE